MKSTPLTEVPIHLSVEGINTLLQHLEEKIIKRIHANPEQFLPKEKENKLQLLSTKEVSDILRVTEVTVRNLCHEGKLKYIRPGSRSMFIIKESLEDYITKIQDNSNE